MTKRHYEHYLLISILFLFYLPIATATTVHDLQAEQSSYTLSWGESETPSFTITCNNDLLDCRCYAKYGTSSYQYIGEIPPRSSKSFSLFTQTAEDQPNKGDDSVTVTSQCNDALYSTYDYDSETVTFSWPTNSEWIAYQAELEAVLQAENEANSAKTAASNAISDANSAINSAQSRINEASSMSADVSSATQYLNNAEADYTSANSYLSSGNSAYSSEDYDSATNYYEQAQSKANSVLASAANAESMVDKIIEEYTKEETEAQNEVSDANSAIDTAKQRVDAADKIIADATLLGLDTAQAKADIATARSKIDTAEDYYSEASNMFDTENFDSAKSKAQSATSLANEAEELATGAYNSLNERMTVAGEASKSILNANSEISQMNEILTKMDYILISAEKWGVDLTETESIVSTAKTNVDSAEDLLSQAKNRLNSGSFDDAVNSANEARDKAASSRNRLDTITQTISLSIEEALEAAYTTLQEKLAEAKVEVESAQNTYGATPELVVKALDDITSAESNLQQAATQIQSVKDASDLIGLLEEAEAAFTSLDNAEELITSSIDNANSAKAGLTKKIAIGAAIAAGAAGGGFLYYRQRKKKAESKKESEKEEKIEKDKEQKAETKKEEKTKINKCPKCGHEVKKGNFCNKCGTYLK